MYTFIPNEQDENSNQKEGVRLQAVARSRKYRELKADLMPRVFLQMQRILVRRQKGKNGANRPPQPSSSTPVIVTVSSSNPFAFRAYNCSTSHHFHRLSRHSSECKRTPALQRLQLCRAGLPGGEQELPSS